jgi:hypothetical protein
MRHSITTIFSNPDIFFQDLMTEKENLRNPALIVTAGGVVAAAYAYEVGGLTGQMMGKLMAGMGTIIAVSAIAGALIGALLFWVIWSGIFFALSSLFKGKGSFRRTMESVGYGYLPQVAGNVITLIISFFYIPKVRVPEISAAAMQDPQVIQEAIKVLMHDPAMMELAQISSIITIVVLLLSANIWIFGLKHAQALPIRDAAICVLVPRSSAM